MAASVTGIDRCARAVEQRLSGNSYNWYGGGRNYSRYRNFGRVEGITRVERKNYGLKVTGVASSGYGGYQGWNQRGYGNYGYSAGADLKFECKVYRNGQIRDIDIKRRTRPGGDIDAADNSATLGRGRGKAFTKQNSAFRGDASVKRLQPF